MFVKANPNPCHIYSPDCVFRAVALATGKTWERVYTELAVQGFVMCTPPTVNYVWGAYLEEQGFPAYEPARECSVRKFAKEHPKGVYIIGTGTHAVTVKNGAYFDAWDSGGENVLYYFVLEG